MTAVGFQRDFLETRLVGDNIWSITGPANDLMYLVVGTERAMLVDTGMGIGRLADVVRGLTSLPVIVVNTHGHPDHAGGDSSFEEAWLHPKDNSVMREMCADEYRLRDLKAFLGEGSPDYARLAGGMVPFKPDNIKPLKAGQIFDVGKRAFEVLEVPGHTPGSICLLSSKERVMFTGDSVIETPVWLYTKHALPVRVFHEALKRVKEREKDFETLFPGHYPLPVGREHLDDLISCTGEVLNSPGIGELTKTFAGEGLLWKHGKCSIIYRPDNLT